MVLINPSNALYNTLLFYIIIVTLILLLKPKFMYSYKKNRFKSFGFGKHKTLFCLPIICISSGILLYLFFLTLQVLFEGLD